MEIVKRLIDNYVVPKNCPPRTLAYKESFNTYEKMCNLLSKMPLTSYLSGECRVGLYGEDIDELQSVICKKKLDDRWWEL